MSRENVEAVERFFELFNLRRMDAWAATFASDVEWHVDPQDPESTVYRDREAVTRYALAWIEAMDSAYEMLEVFDAGDQVVAWGRVRSRGEASGIAVEQPLAWVFTLRDGVIVRVQQTQDKAEALDAAGLQE